MLINIWYIRTLTINFWSIIKLEAQWAEPVSLTFHFVLSNLYRGLSRDASYQVSVHLAKQFQKRRFFRNQPIRNKNCLWWPYLSTDWEEMSSLYRGPSIDAPYQVSIHLAKGFQRRRLKCEKLMDDRRQMPSDGKSSHCLWQGELNSYPLGLYVNYIF